MIFLFDTSLINKAYAKLLAECLKIISRKKHKIDYNCQSVWNFIEGEVLTTTNIGGNDIDLILCNHELRDINNNDRNYYTQITIGSCSGMCDLPTLYIILNTPSCVVLENASYEWCVIKRWVDYVKNDVVYKEINRKVNEAICRNWIIPEHAGGGNGTISIRIESLVKNTYFTAGSAKITTIYDSDKVSSTDTTDHNEALKIFLSTNNYRGHEWKRREIENYIPLKVFEYANFFNVGVTKPSTISDDWNYLDIKEHPYFKGKYKKKKLAQLANYIDASAVKESFAEKNFINPVDNHPVSELQHIIFLLAKYI